MGLLVSYGPLVLIEGERLGAGFGTFLYLALSQPGTCKPSIYHGE
jgi:hypothetical protein